MNKRIKKKRSKSDFTRYLNTAEVVNLAVTDWIGRTEQTEKGYAIGPVRYNTYLRKLKIHKRDTELGSAITKHRAFD